MQTPSVSQGGRDLGASCVGAALPIPPPRGRAGTCTLQLMFCASSWWGVVLQKGEDMANINTDVELVSVDLILCMMSII